MIGSTRRNFIKRTVAATATLGFTAGCRRLKVTDGDDLSRGAIDHLRAKLKGRLIAPGDPERSVLLHRIAHRGTKTGQMPQVGTNVVDESAVKLMRAWIESLRPK